MDRFVLVVAALCRGVAACHGRGLMSGPVIILVWGRIKRVEFRLLALMERIRMGRHREGGARAVSPDRVATPRSGVAGCGLPRRFGWLIGLMPHEAACYGGQLATVLAEPEMVALLADVPQARRILAPLCRMLGVALEAAPRVRRVVVRVKPVVAVSPPVVRRGLGYPGPSGLSGISPMVAGKRFLRR